MPQDPSKLPYRRILIYGVTGSGKTTFAARLAEKTGLPWHSVDDLTWRPNWEQVPPEEQRITFEEICAEEEWILDTAYKMWADVPLERAELIVGLDYPRWLSLSRLLNRTLRRAIDKRPICNGNRETWLQMFSKDSIIIWHFRSFGRKRARMRKWAESAEGPKVMLFNSPKRADEWLNSL